MSDIQDEVEDFVEGEAQEQEVPVINIESEWNISALKAQISDNLKKYESAFNDRDESITEIIRQREMRPSSNKRDEDGRLATVPPITASAGNVAYGHVKNYFNGRDKFWDTKAHGTGKDVEKMAEVLEDYLNMLADSPTDLNLRAKNNVIISDQVFLGCKYVKIFWDETQMTYRFQNVVGETIEKTYIKHFGPALMPLDTRDTVYPPGFDSVDEAPWFAHRVRVSKTEYKRMFDTGVIKNYEASEGEEEIFKEPSDAVVHPDVVEESERRGEVIDTSDMADFFEVFTYFEAVNEDGSGTGAVCDYVVWYSQTDDKILRVEPNFLGQRPIVPIYYFKIPGSLGGLGVGHFTAGAQRDAEFWNNVRQQNAKFAVNKTFWARLGTVNDRIRVSPGKVHFYNGGQEDIPQEMAVRDVPGSSMEFEDRSFRYSQIGSGISSIMGGMADPTLKSRDTFAGQSFRYKQGMGILGAVMEEAEYGFSQMAIVLLKFLILNAEKVMQYERSVNRWTEDKLALLEQALKMDIEMVPVALKMSIKTTDLEQTGEALRQNYLLVSQLTEQFSDKILNLYMTMANPQVPPQIIPVIEQIIVSKAEMLQKILEDLSITDKDHIVPDVRLLAMKLDMRNAQISALVESMKNQASALGGVNAGQGQIGQAPIPVDAGSSGIQQSPGGSAPGAIGDVQGTTI